MSKGSPERIAPNPEAALDRKRHSFLGKLLAAILKGILVYVILNSLVNVFYIFKPKTAPIDASGTTVPGVIKNAWSYGQKAVGSTLLFVSNYHPHCRTFLFMCPRSPFNRTLWKMTSCSRRKASFSAHLRVWKARPKSWSPFPICMIKRYCANIRQTLTSGPFFASLCPHLPRQRRIPSRST